MTDQNSENIDTDLTDFETEFFGLERPEPEVEETVEKEVDSEEDTLANEQDLDEDEQEVDEVDEPEDKPKRKRQTARERIQELNTKYREAERAQIELRERLAALESQVKPADKAPEPVAENAEPTPDDLLEDGSPKYPLGEYDRQFVKDFIQYNQERTAAEIEARNRVAQEQAERAAEAARLTKTWQEKVAQVEEDLPDFQEVSASLEPIFRTVDQEYGEFVASTIMSLDHGPEVLYHLAENLDVAEDILESSPRLATIKLGRLDAKFEKRVEPTPKITEAPEPPAARTRGTGTKVDVPDDTTDLDAFAEKFFKRK